MRTGLAILALMALAACNAASPTTQVVTQTVPAQAAPASGASFMALLNSERAQNGRSALQEDSRLTRSAQAHAEDMQRNGYFSHTSLDGSSFADRARAAGYACPRAENIASGQRTYDEVVTSWMNSPGHRRNMLRDDVVEYGIGRTADYWVLVFGTGC